MSRSHFLPRILCLGLVLFLCLGRASAVSAGTNVWTSNGPVDDAVYSMVIDPLTPATLYAGTMMHGVYKSTDSGGSWNPVNTGLADSQVMALAIDPTTPSTVYSGVYSDGVYKTLDGGGIWSAINTGLTNPYISVLAIDPLTPSTLYAGTNGGVFKTTDGGGVWSLVNIGLTYQDVRTLAVDPSTPATIYAGTWGGGVFKSTDGGSLWNPTNTGLTYPDVGELLIDPTDTNILYAGTLGGGVFKSTDGGGSWTAVNTGIGYLDTITHALAIDPAAPDTLYLGNQSGVMISLNGGGSWQSFNDGLGVSDHVTVLVVNPVTTALVHAGVDHGESGGVYSRQSSAPGAFTKSGPPNGAHVGMSPLLSWDASSGATLYEYCYDTTDDDACAGSWTITETTSAGLSGLMNDTAYYWHVYAINPYTSTWSDGGWWSFTTRYQTFADVPTDYWAWPYIERLYYYGITGGCGNSPLIYCPASPTTRGQTAIFLERGMNGSAYTPPPATGTVFADVPISHWAAAWIEKLYADGITGGCGGGNYCPNQAVTRAEMAIFLLRAEHGSSYTPPAATGTVFKDVPVSYWAAAWIEQLNAEGITGGCGGGNYCPSQAVTRAEMAVFFLRTFSTA